MNSKKIAILAAANASGEQGGAEKFYQALTNALCAAGVQAELLNILTDESSFEKIEETYLRFYDLNLSDYDGVISTKAPAYVVRHPNHISYLQHTIRVFYDMFEVEFPTPSQQMIERRELIHKLDAATLSYPYTKKVFVIGHEVRNRLLKYIKIDSEVIHESLVEENFKCGEYEDYLFMPGRLHRWKRVDMIIKAMQYVKAPIKLKIAGVGEEEAYYRDLACGDKRIEFLGRVSDEELVKLYSNALAVLFVPIREDFGLITIEAFRSGKPVLTCTDSGEPTHFVRDGETGFICKPDPRDIAGKLEYLFHNPKLAKEIGGRGFQSVKHLAWGNIADRLIKELKL